MGVCATDAHKLFTDSIESDCEEFGVILPSSGFKPLLNIIANVSEVSAVIGAKNISFTTSDSALHCRLVEGNYPNFKAVIPQNNGVEVKVSKSELLDSVNRASIMANKSTSLLKLSFTDTTMSIVGSDNDFSTKACENISVEKSGADVSIGVKSEFFATCLSIVSAEEVILKLGDSNRAIVIEDSLCKDRVMLVMPMSI
jgi:DNA polymerase-3 subunit beta